MTVSFVASSTAQASGTGVALTVSSPAGVAAGDQLFLALKTSGDPPYTPAGWTLDGYNSPTGAVTFCAYHRSATATSADQAVFPSGHIASPHASMAAYRGALAAPGVVTGNWASPGFGGSATLPTLTLPTLSDVVIAWMTTSSAIGTSASTGYTYDKHDTVNVSEFAWEHATAWLSGTTAPSLTADWGQGFAMSAGTGASTMMV